MGAEESREAVDLWFGNEYRGPRSPEQITESVTALLHMAAFERADRENRREYGVYVCADCERDFPALPGLRRCGHCGCMNLLRREAA